MYKVASFAAEELETLDNMLQQFLDTNQGITVISMAHSAFNPSFQRNDSTFTLILIYAQNEQKSSKIAQKSIKK